MDEEEAQLNPSQSISSSSIIKPLNSLVATANNPNNPSSSSSSARPGSSTTPRHGNHHLKTPIGMTGLGGGDNPTNPTK